MSRTVYTPEMKDFIQKEYMGRTNAELAEAVNAAFGLSLTAEQMNAYKKTRGMKAHASRKGRPTALWPQDARDFIRLNARGHLTEDLTRLINAALGTSYTEGQVTAFRKVNHYPSGVNTEFKPGGSSWCKGKDPREYLSKEALERMSRTWFKKGDDPWNHLPVGSERKRVNSRDGELWFIKVAEPNVWELKQHALWERWHGPVPKGMKVTFLDNDHSNFSPDNLVLISGADHAYLNRNGLRIDKDLCKASISYLRLQKLINEKEDSNGNEEHTDRPQ